MRKLIVENWAAILLAILIGTLTVFPAFYFRYFDGAYRGLDFLGSDHEDFYVTQIQEIYDGHWSLGNSYLAEGKDNYYVFPPLGPIIMASFGKVLGVSARDINLITKFLFPAILTIIVYSLFFSLTGRKDIAILMSAFVMLVQATWIFLNPGSWLPFLSKGEFLGTDRSFISYARTINPQISSIFFFGYLLCLWKFLFVPFSEKSQKIFGIASAVILGLSFYVYFYTYSFLAVFTGVLAIWFLYFRDWVNFKRIMLVFLGAFIVGILYLVNFWGALHSPFYDEFTRRAAIFGSHKFIFSQVWWGTAIIFLLAYRKFDKFKMFILTFLAAAFIVTNQQIITGKTAPMLAHYHWYYIAPVSGAILIYLLFLYLGKIAPLWVSRIGMILLLSLFLYAGVLYQKVSYAGAREWFVSLQRYAPVISWLDKNIKKESSVLTDEDLSELIPAYTRHNIYSGGEILSFLVDENRLKHNLYVSTFLNGVGKDDVKRFFYENRDSVILSVFGQYYREKNGCYGCSPDLVLDQLISEYQDFLSQDFVGELKKYQIDYILWDKEKYPSWKIDRFFNQKLYDKDNLIIYSAS